MYQEIVTKLDLDETASILDQLNPEFEGTIFDPVETTILTTNCSFYPNCKLLDIADHTTLPAKQRFVIYNEKHVQILNFSNEEIYKLNQEIPVLLTKETILDYIRFFFTYVHGRYGRFIIIENTEDINWKDEPPPTTRKTIGKMITPLVLENKTEDNIFYVNVSMIFKDSLFKAKIKVESNGFVSLSDEELLIEDMPILDDIFGQ